MKFKEGKIEGVHAVQLVKHVDWRGYLIETFRLDMLPNKIQPQMSYVSFTEPGIARGPHEHRRQTDMFAFIGPGNFFIKLWDNREHSKSFGNVMTYVAGMDNPLLVVVPPGVVHGYKNNSRTERGMVLNYPDKLFRGWNKKDDVDETRHEEQADNFYRDFMHES
jgi:dTDP-4-dehydrorhamnose 3,5-epimerase